MPRFNIGQAIYNPRLNVWGYYEGRAISGDIFVSYADDVWHRYAQYGIFLPRRWNSEGVKIFSSGDISKESTEV